MDLQSLKSMLHGSDETTRRQFAAYTAQACLGVGIAGNLAVGAAPGDDPSLTSVDPTQTFGGSKRTAKHVIYFYMGGGMSHLDTFDPKPNNKTVQGPTKAISTAADGIQISEHFPDLAKQMKNVSLVRSLNTTQGAHAQGNYLMHTSYTQRGTIAHPCMGSWTVRMKGKLNPTLPGFVIVGGTGRSTTSGFLENKYGPAPVGTLKVTAGRPSPTLPVPTWRQHSTNKLSQSLSAPGSKPPRVCSRQPWTSN